MQKLQVLIYGSFTYYERVSDSNPDNDWSFARTDVSWKSEGCPSEQGIDLDFWNTEANCQYY